MIEINVGKYNLRGADWNDDDPRGIVHIWEPPRASANYVVACDPSYGLASWDRALRTEDDEKTDNCAIQVIRVGTPDVQVAEYAAPIDAEDAAAIVNFLGRMYAGTDEDGQAHTIVEVQPGPGLLTQRELINTFGYTNLYLWQYLDGMATQDQKNTFGWRSSRQSRQMLWIRGTRHINKKGITINSPYLVEEMTDLVLDNFLSFTARAQWGAHDDRMVSILLGIWAANAWSFENAPEEAAKPEIVGAADYQRTAISYEDMMDSWNDRFAALHGE